MARPLPYTLLSLPRWAEIAGINPAHFMGAAGSVINPVTRNACQDVWPRYSWQQSDIVSQQHLAETIRQAELDIAGMVGYWPAPVWTVEEVQQYPRSMRREAVSYGNLNVRWFKKSLRTRWGYLMAPGQREVSLLEAGSTPAYSDPDGDGVDELATITVATTLTDPREIHVYFAGEGGAREWQIRNPISKTITGGNFIATFESWALIDPDISAAYPTTDGFSAVSIDNTASYVTEVDVYQEYNDTTEVSSQLWWEPENRQTMLCSSCGGAGCTACALTTQDGCMHIRDAKRGVVVASPAEYDADDAQWEAVTPTECREPDYVKLWYQSGHLSQQFLNSTSMDPLSPFWAETIAMLATARLKRPVCSCASVKAYVEYWQEDIGMSGEGRSHFRPQHLYGQPFGTRRGEIEAWQRLNSSQYVRTGVAVV